MLRQTVSLYKYTKSVLYYATTFKPTRQKILIPALKSTSINRLRHLLNKSQVTFLLIRFTLLHFPKKNYSLQNLFICINVIAHFSASNSIFFGITGYSPRWPSIKLNPTDNVFIATNFEFLWHCMQKSITILISKMKRLWYDYRTFSFWLFSFNSNPGRRISYYRFKKSMDRLLMNKVVQSEECGSDRMVGEEKSDKVKWI